MKLSEITTITQEHGDMTIEQAHDKGLLNRKKQITVTIDSNINDKLDMVASEKLVSRSTMVNIILNEYFKYLTK